MRDNGLANAGGGPSPRTLSVRYAMMSNSHPSGVGHGVAMIPAGMGFPIGTV